MDDILTQILFIAELHGPTFFNNDPISGLDLHVLLPLVDRSGCGRKKRSTLVIEYICRWFCCSIEFYDSIIKFYRFIMSLASVKMDFPNEFPVSSAYGSQEFVDLINIITLSQTREGPDSFGLRNTFQFLIIERPFHYFDVCLGGQRSFFFRASTMPHQSKSRKCYDVWLLMSLVIWINPLLYTPKVRTRESEFSSLMRVWRTLIKNWLYEKVGGTISWLRKSIK